MNADDVPIRRPCPVDHPCFDEGVCRHCREEVTDLSAGTVEEARAWLAARRSGCVTYRTDRRGQIRFGLRSVVTGALATAASLTATVAPLTTVPVGGTAGVEAVTADVVPPAPVPVPVEVPVVPEATPDELTHEELAELLSIGGYVAADEP
mgnify:CR=1 FL=1